MENWNTNRKYACAKSLAQGLSGRIVKLVSPGGSCKYTKSHSTMIKMLLHILTKQKIINYSLYDSRYFWRAL